MLVRMCRKCSSSSLLLVTYLHQHRHDVMINHTHCCDWLSCMLYIQSFTDKLEQSGKELSLQGRPNCLPTMHMEHFQRCKVHVFVAVMHARGLAGSSIASFVRCLMHKSHPAASR